MDPIPRLIRLNDHLYDLNEHPLVMGILNHTPDSFYAGSRVEGERAICERLETILQEGGDLVDVGGYSTRPDASDVPLEEEWRRVQEVLRVVRTHYPSLLVSVDTFRAEVARRAVAEGAVMINDVSGGTLDAAMLETIATLKVPYVLMHMRGTPQTMQQKTDYPGRVADTVISELLPTISRLQDLGVSDVVIDPGFGFSKNLSQNYQMMADLYKFNALELPLLVGVSRKSMVYKLLETTPDEALNGTTVLHTYALLHGANILRVHDVAAAREAVTIVSKIQSEEVVY